jgi:hypothetical protein
MTKFTVPFTGTMNTRLSITSVPLINGGVVGLGIVGIMIVGKGSTASSADERYINSFLVSSGPQQYVMKRPGFAASITPAAGSVGSALLIWSGNGQKIMSTFGAVNSTLYESTTSKGAITGVATAITETVVSDVPTLVISSSDSTAWYHDTTTATKITDAQFPGNNSLTLAGTFAHMDGYAFIMSTNGKLWNSDLNSVTSWTALGFVSANAYPDAGVGCIRHKNNILAFGTESMQPFYNAGNATGSPLQRIANATVKVGAINAGSIGQISDIVFFVGSSPQGGTTVYAYDGGVQRISTPEQDYQLIIAGPNNISLTTLKFYGRSFVVVNAGTNTFVYCVEDKRWHVWNSSSPRLWYRCAGLSSGSQILTYGISDVSTGGKIYVIDPSAAVFRDDSMLYTASVHTLNVDLGDPGRKTWEELRIVADRQATSSLLDVAAADDDNYPNFVYKGTVDLSQPSPVLTRLGSSRLRAWAFSHSSDTPFRMLKAYGRATVGS